MTWGPFLTPEIIQLRIDLPQVLCVSLAETQVGFL